MSNKFDFDEALKALQSGKAITGKDGVLTPLIKKLTEAALEGELDSHLAEDVAPNRKNGKTSKTVKSTAGPFELDTPRDRAGTFEPQLVKKHQTSVSQSRMRSWQRIFAAIRISSARLANLTGKRMSLPSRKARFPKLPSLMTAANS